jgi:lysosomal alpha-glucosidase
MNKTDDYWYYLFKKFLDEIPIDGLWIDMNEIAGFCDGSCDPQDIRNDKLNNPPYLPTKHKIYHKALYMDAKNSLTTQYNSHNLYGHFESISTYNMLLKYRQNKRPFIITRSSFPGTGIIFF